LQLQTPDGRQLTLRFVALGGVYYVVPAAVRTPWASYILGRGEAVIRLSRDREVPMGASLVLEPELARSILERFRSLHGERAWSRYFAGRTKVIALRPGAPSAPPSEFDRIRDEFNAVAPSYARAVASDPVDAYLRERSTSRLTQLLNGLDPILEVGCGTGSETLPLLRLGHQIVAVDISVRMLEELRSRAEQAGVSSQLTTVEGRLARLDDALRAFGPGAFRAGFSTFGAFNLERDLSTVGPALLAALRPGAPLFLAVLNRHALMPLAAAIGSRHWGAFSARLRNPIPADSSRYPLDVYARRPYEISEALGSGFQLEALEAASVLAPPDDLPRARRAVGPRGTSALRRWDERLARTRLGAEVAEWQFLTYRRRADRADGV